MQASNQTNAKSCKELVEAFRKTPQPKKAAYIPFAGVGERDVYNISAPFLDQEEQVIAGRVEKRDSEASEVYFFVKREGTWVPKDGAPILTLQDPFVTFIQGELVVGGVETFPHPEIPHALGWRTIFYKGSSVTDLHRFFEGPDGMKDLRFMELSDGSIGIATRPQGEKGGRGKIGFTKASTLNDISVGLVEEAPLFQNQFLEEEWGGGNELHLLTNGLIGVLGHIACFDDEENRHYYPMVFAVDPESGEATNMQIIAERSNFLPGEAKRPDLIDVVFSGGLVRQHDGTAILYAGISDAAAQSIQIKDPFDQFEK